VGHRGLIPALGRERLENRVALGSGSEHGLDGLGRPEQGLDLEPDEHKEVPEPGKRL
jgi:hypothetical protein